MTYHRTESGHVERLASGGHGNPFDFAAWAKRPATLTTDDGDGNYEAWACSGSREHAAQKLAEFLIGERGDCVVTRDGSRVAIENAPDGFWIDKKTGEPFDGERHMEAQPNLIDFPNVIAW